MPFQSKCDAVVTSFILKTPTFIVYTYSTHLYKVYSSLNFALSLR